MKKIIRIALSLVIACSFVAFSCINAYAIARIDDGVTYDSENTEEIPLLIISASFDADGDGENDFDPDDPTKLYNSANINEDYFGEQWANLSADDYYDDFFNKKYSVANFYREMTLNRLTFVPATFDVDPDTEHDGCIDVVVHQVHPSAGTTKYPSISNGDFAGQSIRNIIMAIDPYIDLSRYDKNGDGLVTQHELLIVIMNSGPSQESSGINATNGGLPRGYWAVWSTSQGVTVTMDGVTFTPAMGCGNVTNMGEYTTWGNRQYVGTACHELAHNLGAEDIYDRKVGASGTAKTPWPFVGYFSLQCNGNYAGGGATPNYLDPYQRIYLGWADEVVVGEGEYTLYSTCTGKYQVLRVNTPNPDEYYLIELRYKEGFEVNLTSGTTYMGGICVWHIDESVNRTYFTSGTACSNYVFNGSYHNPGISVLHSYNNTFYGIPNKSTNEDPFFHLDGKTKYNLKFESMNYKSPVDGSVGLYNYTENWVGEKYWNLIVEPLSNAGEEMQIRITIESKGAIAPEQTLSTVTASGNTVYALGSYADTELEIKDFGYEIATNVAFTDNYQKISAADAADGATFTDLLENKTYRVRTYIETADGFLYSAVKLVKTGEAEKAAVNFNNNGSVTTQEVKVGELITEPDPGTLDGYTFDGWYADANFTTKFDFTKAVSASGEINIYAKWTQIPVETTAESTTAASMEPATKSGCGSLVGSMGIVTMAVTLAGMAIVIKKKY